MNASNRIFCNLLLAASLLGIPAFGQELTGSADTTVGAGGVETAVKTEGGGHHYGHHEKGGGGKCEGGQCEGGPHRGGMSLSDDQLEKMAALKEQLRESTGAQMLELRHLKHKQRDLMTQPTVDRSQILALQDRVNSIRSALAISHLNYRLDREAVLTPEQRAHIRHHMLMEEVVGQGGHHGHGQGKGHDGHQ